MEPGCQGSRRRADQARVHPLCDFKIVEKVLWIGAPGPNLDFDAFLRRKFAGTVN
jgi:hypothetical protein